jgi:pSer/pThr/pTyr-binding forkhead associated (FHA) protein/S1-C subfamily serine protease
MPRIVLKDLDTEKALVVSDLEATLGRDPACGFVIDGPKSKVVSGRHARVFFQDNAWWIEDTSRNGTVLDDERLQAGQRHAIRVGQVVGLGESGPRFRVAALESRKVAETVMELPDLDAPPPAPPEAASTAPRKAPGSAAPASAASRKTDGPPVAAPTPASDSTTAMRRSEAQRAGIRFEEETEPMSPAPDWLVQIELRATNTNQRFDVTSLVVKIGRSPECNVQVPPEMGASVSRVHAEVAIFEGGVIVRDAGSRNGTFVNGKRIDAPHPAAKGDLIMLGSGGPTFSIEDLHIVKGQDPQPGSGGAGEPTPAEAKAAKSSRQSVEPRTDPSPMPKAKGVLKAMGPATSLARRSFAGAGRTAFFKDVLEDMSEQSAKRVRIIVWASVTAMVAIAVVLLGVMQWRVQASEERLSAERQRFEVRADSIRIAATADAERLRASFDSARSSSAPRAVIDSLRDALADASRRTGLLEQSLSRARESLNEQLASGDSSRRRAEQEMIRLRSEVGRAAGGEASRASLDSLRRALKAAEDRANEVAAQVRAVRGSNLAQVAQHSGAVGLLVSFIGERVVSGSGFAITPSGYFITNRHVVVDDSGKVRDTIYVTMANQRFTLANRIRVVALGSKDLDIAVVKIPDYRGPYMKKVDWNASGANQGEAAALIGFPYGVELAFDDTASQVVRTSMSAGIFSKVAPDRIQFDGFTVGGSSGSPIFNAAGEVVAVHRAGLTGGPGLGFSIPVSRVVSLLPADARSELGIR